MNGAETLKRYEVHLGFAPEGHKLRVGRRPHPRGALLHRPAQPAQRLLPQPRRQLSERDRPRPRAGDGRAARRRHLHPRRPARAPPTDARRTGPPAASPSPTRRWRRSGRWSRPGSRSPSSPDPEQGKNARCLDHVGIAVSDLHALEGVLRARARHRSSIGLVMEVGAEEDPRGTSHAACFGSEGKPSFWMRRRPGAARVGRTSPSRRRGARRVEALDTRPRWRRAPSENGAPGLRPALSSERLTGPFVASSRRATNARGGSCHEPE